MGSWGGLGKMLMKAAPIAANFIPGVGPLASMAIGAGTNALSNKMEGGSWKGALGNAALGAGMGYLGGKIPGAKGIGPTSTRDKIFDAARGGLDIAQGMGRKRDPNNPPTGRAVDRPGTLLPEQGGYRPGGLGPGGETFEVPQQPNLDILSRMRGQTPQDFTPNLDYMNPRKPMGGGIAPSFTPPEMPPPVMSGTGGRMPPIPTRRRTGSAVNRPSVY